MATLTSIDQTKPFSYPPERESLALSLIALCARDSPFPTLLEVKEVLDRGADAWYQDESGWTCLHYLAAHVESCIKDVEEIVKILLARGGVWNLTNSCGHTAGDIAFSLNNKNIYQLLLDEGIRSEMLNSILDRLGDDVDDSDDISDNNDEGKKDTNAMNIEADEEVVQDKEKITDEEVGQGDTAVSNAAFLASPLTYLTSSTGQSILVDAQKNGVMMGWEAGIMEATARLLSMNQSVKMDVQDENQEWSVLNVGFGLGLIDKQFQNLEEKPGKHVIIEPHPSVLAHMREEGWYEKKGVQIFEGTWQMYIKAIESEEIQDAQFDSIYFDTFSEHYTDLRQFFEQLPNLLRSTSSTFSFFNGLGGSSRLFWDVYTSVSELHLREIGLKCHWYSLPVKGQDVGDGQWEGIKRVYWSVPGEFRIPIAKLEM